MNRTVVHHIYSGGIACDLSGYRNHGVPYDVSEASAPYAPAFGYSSPGSRVIVPQSQSLQDEDLQSAAHPRLGLGVLKETIKQAQRIWQGRRL